MTNRTKRPARATNDEPGSVSTPEAAAWLRKPVKEVKHKSIAQTLADEPEWKDDDGAHELA